jgi:hypothetical protein
VVQLLQEEVPLEGEVQPQEVYLKYREQEVPSHHIPE